MDQFDIIAALKRAGYTQSRVAVLLRVPVSVVNGVIHGHTKSIRTARYIAAMLGTTPDVLWPSVSYDYVPRAGSRRRSPRVSNRTSKPRGRRRRTAAPAELGNG